MCGIVYSIHQSVRLHVKQLLTVLVWLKFLQSWSSEADVDGPLRTWCFTNTSCFSWWRIFIHSCTRWSAWQVPPFAIHWCDLERPFLQGQVIFKNRSGFTSAVFDLCCFSSLTLTTVKHDWFVTVSDGPLSPGHVPVSMVTVSNSNKPDSVNLMKWFGTDMLKTSLPTMPPLPVQGQRVLTLDEIERL